MDCFTCKLYDFHEPTFISYKYISYKHISCK